MPTPTPETEKPKPETEKPKPEPETEPKPTPETEKPKPEPETEPKPTPETEIPKKDPSKSPTVNTQPNDDLGPGPSTNNGVGATTSTADQPTNSNHYETVEEYRQDVEELKVINQEQKTGNDPSIPSTPPTATAPVANVDSNVNAQPSTQPVTVDNNGDTGSVVKEPSGEVVKVEPINTPTPVAPLAVAADTGQAISDSPGEAWGGPAD